MTRAVRLFLVTTRIIYVEECVEAVLGMRLTASQRNRVHMWRDSALKVHMWRDQGLSGLTFAISLPVKRGDALYRVPVRRRLGQRGVHLKLGPGRGYFYDCFYGGLQPVWGKRKSALSWLELH